LKYVIVIEQAGGGDQMAVRHVDALWEGATPVWPVVEEPGERCRGAAAGRPGCRGAVPQLERARLGHPSASILATSRELPCSRYAVTWLTPADQHGHTGQVGLPIRA